MQIFEFVKMREQAEKTIKPSTNDIMKKPSKKITEQIPSFSQSVTINFTQLSQDMSIKLSTSQASV